MIVENLWVFALAALLLNLTPGNDMLYVIARSSGQGIKAGVISALGIGAGCLIHIFAAVAGLSALIAQSAWAFSIIKYAGALYLVYLGIKSILNKRNNLTIDKKIQKISYQKTFWQGLITNVLNPKVALFFLAFLPQFINIHHGNVAGQILFLGSWFDVGGTVVNVLVAILFGKIGYIFSNSTVFIQWQQRVTGIILIGLGIKVALSSKK
jgi:threonine/homoserine/homoserine lactone efflux protein